jgi:L-threonylcarbamoyladenylate synthase
VLPVAESNTVCELARSGLDTQAVRCPAHPVALELLNRLGKPLAAPSANKSGRISPTTAEHVRREFGTDLSHILDGGAAVKGLESTVLSVIEDEVTLLRPGSLSTEDITTIIGPVRSALHDDTAPRSPGMLSRHYAPEARLRLNADRAKSEDEAFLGFGPADCRVTLNLSPTCDMTEAASNLYAMLRSLDEQYAAIAVANIPETGLGEAINDRLRRAAL